MGGDKIVLLDGAGANGGGAATNGLLSMIPGMFANLIGGNKMDPNLVAALMNSSRVEYEFDNTNDLNHIIFKGNCREPFSFSRVLVEELIKTFETIRDRYSDNYELKVYLYNCIIQLSVNPKDPSESFFGVYDRDEMKLIYGIKISILKGMFGI